MKNFNVVILFYSSLFILLISSGCAEQCHKVLQIPEEFCYNRSIYLGEELSEFLLKDHNDILYRVDEWYDDPIAYIEHSEHDSIYYQVAYQFDKHNSILYKVGFSCNAKKEKYDISEKIRNAIHICNIVYGSNYKIMNSTNPEVNVIELVWEIDCNYITLVFLPEAILNIEYTSNQKNFYKYFGIGFCNKYETKNFIESTKYNRKSLGIDGL